ncbi:cysteine hydrolase family protein [Cohnella lupini]|uniref:Nicotinamidase-related amidase n=1 Tax=Cohnella lupini TaxID=1294267 RepID=A0A3D9I4A6_9BACL|nr:cysteine hydrolase family protein [Cohnella lupini]RED56574.1 nicotinamidase-related amidase [Cohnella lupini]
MEKGNAALLLVDVQNAMFSYESSLYREDEVMDNIVGLVSKARASEVPVIYIQHTGYDDGDEFLEGSHTWQIDPRIQPLVTESVIMKTTCDSFHKTGLEEELRKRNIENLIIAGMQTEFCIDTTSRRAFSMGYGVTLVKDAHSTFDSANLTAAQIVEHHNYVLGGAFARLTATNDIVF